MLLHPDLWKSLRDRYQQDRPHRMLALDGGGIRGLITLGILERIEKLVMEKEGLKLAEYFDYIAGTSTGAIIAAGLFRGLTTAELIPVLRVPKAAYPGCNVVEKLEADEPSGRG